MRPFTRYELEPHRRGSPLWLPFLWERGHLTRGPLLIFADWKPALLSAAWRTGSGNNDKVLERFFPAYPGRVPGLGKVRQGKRATHAP